MQSIGFDTKGEEHLVPVGEMKLHQADASCGCNPDGQIDDPAWRGDYKTPAKTYWIHHTMAT